METIGSSAGIQTNVMPGLSRPLKYRAAFAARFGGTRNLCRSRHFGVYRFWGTGVQSLGFLTRGLGIRVKGSGLGVKVSSPVVTGHGQYWQNTPLSPKPERLNLNPKALKPPSQVLRPKRCKTLEPQSHETVNLPTGSRASKPSIQV